MSLWGSRKKQNGTQEGAEDDESHTGDMPPPSRRSGGSRSREPTERDRLLPANNRPPHADGYLDPDDPAVSEDYAL